MKDCSATVAYLLQNDESSVCVYLVSR